ncbi:MAG: rhombosortase [Gammaproteobacteria bacterium]|nr:rhombosortase [Gammaproteobacteria bacterium]
MIKPRPWRLLLRRWWATLLLGGLWCVLQAHGGLALWGYDRQAIGDGQVWRLLTGQLVHLNAVHLVLNLLGLAGVMAVWSRELAHPVALLGMFLGGVCAVGLGLWWLVPEVAWYAGASGVLHGLFAAGIVLALGTSLRLRAVAAMGLLLKLALEAHLGTGSAELIGAPVIHAAHQFGAFGGVVSALAWRLLRRSS